MAFNGDRLRARRKLLKLSQDELGERVGLSQGAISDLERGIAMETNKLLELARVCGVSPEWLLGKDVPSGQNGEADQAEAAPSNVLRFRREPVAEQRFVPEIDLRGGASYGGGIRDEEWQAGDVSGDRAAAYWGLPASFVEREMGLSYDTIDILPIQGDSMRDETPMSLASGDKVIISRTERDPRQGGIFAVFDGEGVIVKQVELIRGHNPPRIVCKSRNPTYDPIPLTLEYPVRIIGRVVGRITRM